MIIYQLNWAEKKQVRRAIDFTGGKTKRGKRADRKYKNVL